MTGTGGYSMAATRASYLSDAFADGILPLTDGLEVSAAISGQPAVKLFQTQKAWIRNCSVPAGAKAFVTLDGGSTEDVAITNCNLRGAQEVQLGPGVSKESVFCSGNIKAAP